MKLVLRGAACFLLLMAVGCGGSGLTRYRVSGKVTYRGQPVPAGEVRFSPDHEKGNSGPATIAIIVDGAYTTPRGKGVVGGPHKILVTGYQKSGSEKDETAPDFGAAMFPEHESFVTLPEENTTHDIAID